MRTTLDTRGEACAEFYYCTLQCNGKNISSYHHSLDFKWIILKVFDSAFVLDTIIIMHNSLTHVVSVAVYRKDVHEWKESCSITIPTVIWICFLLLPMQCISHNERIKSSLGRLSRHLSHLQANECFQRLATSLTEWESEWVSDLSTLSTAADTKCTFIHALYSILSFAWEMRRKIACSINKCQGQKKKSRISSCMQQGGNMTFYIKSIKLHITRRKWHFKGH